jgi:methylamine--corrinoid protein Co-methyltransferase
MTRHEGNEVAKQLLDMYEDKIDDAPMGKKYQECYDVATGKPCQKYIDLYGQVKEELWQMGFKFKG